MASASSSSSSSSAASGGGGGGGGGGNEIKEKKTAKGLWTSTLKKAMEYDSWGQSLEAIDEYEKLIKLMEAHQKELNTLTSDERNVLQLTVACAKLRITGLHDVTGKKGLKYADVKTIPDVLELMFTGRALPAPSQFPVQLADLPALLGDDAKNSKSKDVEIDSQPATADAKIEGGTLLPAPKPRPGYSSVTITIDKVGLKDAETYFDPHITVSLADEKGGIIETQDTPPSKKHKPNYVLFNGVTVFVQKSWEEIKTGNLTMFLEFKHFKPAKKKVSTRCFAIVEPKEIKSNEQSMQLELYKKPTDFTKKKFSLFSIKQLYLHLTITIRRF